MRTLTALVLFLAAIPASGAGAATPGAPGGGATAPGGPGRGSEERPLPAADRARLERALRAALAALPAPKIPYALDRESVSERVDETVPFNPTRRRWLAPAGATAERSYEAIGRGESDEGPEPIEVRVELNRSFEVPDLASVGGEPALVSIPGATAIEVAMIAPEPERGRLALPLPAGAAEDRLAVLRLYFGSAAAERAVREAVAKRGPAAALREPGRPSDVQGLTVTFHGPKRAVGGLARSARTGALRRLLTR